MKKKQKIYSSDQVAVRYSRLVVGFILLAIVIFVRVGFLMFGEPHDYWMTVGTRNKDKFDTIQAKRGNIVSADGKMLATTLPEYLMYIDFMSWEQDSVAKMRDQLLRDRMLYLKIDSVCEGMHRLFPDVDPEEYRNHLLRGRAECSHRWPIYPKRVTYVRCKEVQALPLFNLSRGRGGGFTPREILKRKNPYGQLAHAIVGVYDEERDSLKTGLEEWFDSYLRGTEGRSHTEKVMSRYVPIVDSMAVDGCDVVTTLDVTMQDLVEKTLRDQLRAVNADIGMCVLMDVPTGDIKAMTSLTHWKDGRYIEVENRACTSRREPGSVFKPMSFMVAFEDKKFDLNKGFYVGNGMKQFYNKTMRDANWSGGGYGRVLSVPEIIKFSSNVGVSGLINEAYGKDPSKFIDGLDRIGIRSDFHIPVKGYKAPNIRYPKKGYWSGTTLPWMSVGYETQIPPVQTLAFYNGVANGGKMVRPRLISAIKRGDEVVEEFPVEYVIPASRGHMMCSEQTLQMVKTCLEGVVGRKNCTGKDVFSERFPIAGKTGTAQIWENGRFNGRYIVSFAGYFPADKPQYSMIVCMEVTGKGSGGGMCGPVFKRIAESLWALKIRADVATTTDTSEHRNDAPLVRPGNLDALSAVLNELEYGYNSSYKKNEDLLWGGNTSGSANSVTLSADGSNAAKKGKHDVMPNVAGYGMRDAVYRLESLGLKVKVSGRGCVVRQSISPGTPLKRNMKVELVLATAGRYKNDGREDPDSAKKEEPVAAPPPKDEKEEATSATD